MNKEKRKKTILEITAYCVLVTIIAWTAPLFGGSPGSFGPGFVIWGMAPLLAAIILRIVAKDWSDAGLKPEIKKNVRWYIISIFAFPAMIAFTFIFGEITGASSFSGFALSPFIKSFLTALPLFFVFAIFEEFGWRGFLVPKIASLGVNNYLMAGIIALVWGTWHMPYIRELTWAYNSENLAVFIPRYYLAMFAFALFYNEVRIITGSVWPAVIMHGITNAFAHPLYHDYLDITPGMDFLVSSSGLAMIVFTALFGIILNIWRTKRRINMP